MNSRIIVSGIGKRNILLKIFREECQKLYIDVVGLDSSPYPPAKIEVNRFFKIPNAKDKFFLRSYSENVKNSLGFLSIIDPEIPLLSKAYDKNLFDCKYFFHPRTSSIDIVTDKYLMYELFIRQDIPTIPTSLRPEFNTPFIVKDRKGSCSSGFKIFKDNNLSIRNYPVEKDKIYQPFCDGKHFCIDAYYSIHTSKLVDLCAKEVINKNSGETYLMKSISPLPFISLLSKMSQTLPLRGIVNLDIYEFNGVLSIMEINPRIGGNYPGSHNFGVNLISKLLEETLDLKIYDDIYLTSYPEEKYIYKYLSFSDPLYEANI